MTVKLLDKQKCLLEEKRKREEEETKKNDEDPPTPKPEDSNDASFTDSQGREHEGVLKIDSTSLRGLRFLFDSEDRNLPEISWKLA